MSRAATGRALLLLAKPFGKMFSMDTQVRPPYSEVRRSLEALEDPDRPGRVLDLLARILDLTDERISDLSGLSRQTINRKRKGKSPVRAEDLWPLADALGVPMEMFWMAPWEAGKEVLEMRQYSYSVEDDHPVTCTNMHVYSDRPLPIAEINRRQQEAGRGERRWRPRQ